MKSASSLFVASGVALSLAPLATAAVIESGSVAMTLQEGQANSIGWLDAYFTAATSRSSTLSLPAPGNAPINRISGAPGTIGTAVTPGVPGTPGLVEITDPVRPFGEVPLTGDGRTRQRTTLDFDPANVLGTWNASSEVAGGAFILGGGTSEQIALTSMQRWGGPFSGVLIYGDFALRYVPARAGTVTVGGTRSGLVLTSNIDFLDAAFADIGNATITSDGSTLTISGDLLIAPGLTLLDPGAQLGLSFGTFALTAAVPGPGASALLGVGGLLGMRRRRS
jgi:hypothetical protein